MKNPITLVHYNAFSSNQAFQYTGPVMVPLEYRAEDILETVFRQCNVVDGTEWISQESAKRIKINGRGLRSMSVGDSVTLIEGGSWETWLCEGYGWKLIGSSTMN